MRDDPNNGCEGDYHNLHLKYTFLSYNLFANQTIGISILNLFISFSNTMKKPKTQSPRQEGEETKSENDKEKETLKEGKDSRESLRERSITKDSSKTKDREKSAKGERGEKEKPSKTGDKVDKSRVGSKLSVVDKPNKSGVASPKGRRMSRMERPGADMALKSKMRNRFVLSSCSFSVVNIYYLSLRSWWNILLQSYLNMRE